MLILQIGSHLAYISYLFYFVYMLITYNIVLLTQILFRDHCDSAFAVFTSIFFS